MGSMRVVLLVAMVSRCLAAAGLNLTSDLPGISNSLNPLLSASIQIIPVVSDTLCVLHLPHHGQTSNLTLEILVD